MIYVLNGGAPEKLGASFTSSPEIINLYDNKGDNTCSAFLNDFLTYEDTYKNDKVLITSELQINYILEKFPEKLNDNRLIALKSNSYSLTDLSRKSIFLKCRKEMSNDSKLIVLGSYPKFKEAISEYVERSGNVLIKGLIESGSRGNLALYQLGIIPGFKGNIKELYLACVQKYGKGEELLIQNYHPYGDYLLVVVPMIVKNHKLEDYFSLVSYSTGYTPKAKITTHPMSKSVDDKIVKVLNELIEDLDLEDGFLEPEFMISRADYESGNEWKDYYLVDLNPRASFDHFSLTYLINKLNNWTDYSMLNVYLGLTDKRAKNAEHCNKVLDIRLVESYESIQEGIIC